MKHRLQDRIRSERARCAQKVRKPLRRSLAEKPSTMQTVRQFPCAVQWQYRCLLYECRIWQVWRSARQTARNRKRPTATCFHLLSMKIAQGDCFSVPKYLHHLCLAAAVQTKGNPFFGIASPFHPADRLKRQTHLQDSFYTCRISHRD